MKTILIATVLILSGCQSSCGVNTSYDASTPDGGSMESSKLLKKLGTTSLTVSETIIYADE